MKHKHRQIELDEIWEKINSGIYAEIIGPQIIHADPGVDVMNIPLSAGTFEIYERCTDEGWKVIPPVGELIPVEIKDAQPLRSKSAYWDLGRPDILAALKVPPEALSNADLIQLVRELDRRFMQLNDKVDFERKYNLVDYKPLANPKD